MTASYDPKTIHISLEKELARLEAQLDCGWTRELSRMLCAGLRDGLDLVEFGCGPGLVIERLLAVLPNSRVVAVDHDHDMIELARLRLADRNVRFYTAPVEATTLAPECCDVVLSRYLFQHLADPLPAAREALRILRPGGSHVIIDVDDACWGLATPQMAGLREIYAKATVAQARRGGNRLIGRDLGRLLGNAGYVDVNLDIYAMDSDDLGLETMRPQLSPERLMPAVIQGDLSLQDYVSAQFMLERFMQTPGAHVIQVGFIAQGVKSR